MDWHNMSSDLNPIEHLWGILKLKVEERKVSNGAFPLHGTARYGSLLGGFHWVQYLEPGTFLVPPWPGFQAIRTVTKT